MERGPRALVNDVFEYFSGKLTAFILSPAAQQLLDGTAMGFLVGFLKKGGWRVTAISGLLGMVSGYFFGLALAQWLFDDPTIDQIRAGTALASALGITLLPAIAKMEGSKLLSKWIG